MYLVSLLLSFFAALSLVASASTLAHAVVFPLATYWGAHDESIYVEGAAQLLPTVTPTPTQTPTPIATFSPTISSTLSPTTPLPTQSSVTPSPTRAQIDADSPTSATETITETVTATPVAKEGIVDISDAYTPGEASAYELETIYEVSPDIGTCDAGLLTEADKEGVLDYLNEIRALHGLAPVSYDAASDEETAEASLIIVADNNMTHFPAKSAECFSKAGAAGSKSSNIAWGAPNETYGSPLLTPSSYFVSGWLVDEDVPALGHRRWLLDPFLQQVSFGRVDGPPVGYDADEFGFGSAIKVIYQGNPSLVDEETPAFVAYPYGNYPLSLFEIGWYWSFGVIADPADRFDNRDVDYSESTITVRRDGEPLRVHSISFNNELYGLPNHLQWQVDGVEMEEALEVEIANVLVNGEAQSFTYGVTLTAPYYPPVDLPVFTINGEANTLGVRSGQTFGLNSVPPATLPNRWSTRGDEVQVQFAHVSPYLSLMRVDGSIGDLAMIDTAFGELTIRVVETEDGVSDPLEAFQEELEMPIYAVTADQQVIEVPPSGQFALYIPPSLSDEQGSIRWSQEAGLELEGEFYNDSILVITIVEAFPGAEATFTLAPDLQVTVKIGEGESEGEEIEDEDVSDETG